MLHLESKSFLVTGGTSGIGLELTKKLLINGGDVHVLSRSYERFEKILNDWVKTNRLNERLTWHKSDFSIPDEIHDIDFKNFPNFDGVINSAGSLSIAPLRSESLGSMLELINVNLLSPMELTRQLLSHKKIKSGGSIIFLSSINGVVVGSRGHTVYAATKGGIKGFAMALAIELASRKIRVNCVSPGMVRTEMYEKARGAIADQAMSDYEKTYPLGFGDPSDVVNYITFLLGDESRWVTGQTVVIDGGVSVT